MRSDEPQRADSVELSPIASAFAANIWRWGAKASAGWVAGAFLLTIWIATHPDLGVYGDARLYLVQALHALHPSKWRGDLYFDGGSQDAYTIFSSIYRYPVAWLGPEHAHLAMKVFGEGLWLTALAVLCRSLLASRTERWAAMAGVLLLSAWAGNGLVGYAETYVTPRIFAQAFVLGALSCGLSRRPIAMCVLLAAAAALQPTMVPCGVGAAAFYAAEARPRLWRALGTAGLAAFLVASATGPMAQVWKTYDPTWWRLVEWRFTFALPGSWDLPTWLRISAILASLSTFLRVADERERRAARAVLTTTVASLGVALVATEGLRNVLLTGLQLWRSLWLAAVAANAALAIVVLRTDRRDAAFWLLAGGMVASAISRFLPAFEMIAPGLILCGCLLSLANSIAFSRFEAPVRVLALATAGVGLLASVAAIRWQVRTAPTMGVRLVDLALAGAAAAGLAISVMRPNRPWFGAAAALLLAASAALADQRTQWRTFVYGAGPDGGLSQFLASSRATWWEGDDGLELLWFRLRSPSYYSCLQGTGAIFFRAQAMEWARRRRVLSGLDSNDAANCRWGARELAERGGAPDAAALRSACKALPRLDTVVLERPVSSLIGRSWRSPVPLIELRQGRLVRVSTFWRYDCDRLR